MKNGVVQTFITYNNIASCVQRIKNWSAETWGNWANIAYDIPTFYKNYADLSSLANALGENFVYNGWKDKDESNPTILTFNVTVANNGFCVLLIQRNFFNIPSEASIVTIGFGESFVTGGSVVCASSKIICSIATTSDYTTTLTVEGVEGNAFGQITIKALSHKGNFSIVRTS